MKAHPSVLTVVVLCVLATTLAALFEVGASLCLSLTVFAAYGAFWTLVLLPFLLWRRSALKFAVHGLFLAGLAALYLVPWSSRKPFLRDLERVRAGMTVEEVESIMGSYMKGTGWPAPPGHGPGPGTLVEAGTGATLRTETSPSGELEIRDSIVYRHSDDGAFDSDWGVVTVEDGRVVAVRFMPD